MSKIIGFLSNKLTLRGTEVAMYDYAHFNETLLGNKSIIITRDYNKISNHYDVSKLAYDKFTNRFIVEYYENQSDIDNIVQKHNMTHLFIEKAGNFDGLISTKCKNLIHCVFTTKQPHGDVYSCIGKVINMIDNTNYPVVPYMVYLPETDENLRCELNIPDNAIVFGRHGGRDNFDITFVHSVIKKILNERNDIYFMFMNTDVFYDHPHIIYLNGNADLIYKRKFINTCDACIHARKLGETFGLVTGEFAICNKPVITFNETHGLEHLLILKDKAVIYNNEHDLYEILNTFYVNKYDMTNNGYLFYNPQNVMKIFNDTFLLN